MKQRICEHCGGVYLVTHHAQKFCPECQNVRVRTESARLRKKNPNRALMDDILKVDKFNRINKTHYSYGKFYAKFERGVKV
jgi:uncharacterized Zn finger protein (UPF0148 family)